MVVNPPATRRILDGLRGATGPPGLDAAGDDRPGASLGGHGGRIVRRDAPFARSGQIPGAWIGRQLDQLDRVDGDLALLMTRLAHVRTWTFVSHRAAWVADAAQWQERAAREALSGELATRVERLVAAAHDAFSVDNDSTFRWEGGAVARLSPGPALLEPGLRMLRHDLLPPSAAQRVQRHVTAFVRDWTTRVVTPLHTPEAEALRGPAQGLLYAVEQGLGVVPAHVVAVLVRALPGRERGRSVGWASASASSTCGSSPCWRARWPRPRSGASCTARTRAPATGAPSAPRSSAACPAPSMPSRPSPRRPAKARGAARS